MGGNQPPTGDARVTVEEAQGGQENEQPHGVCAPVDKCLTFIENWFKTMYNENTSIMKVAFFSILFGLYIAYVMVACIKDFHKAVDLFAISMFVLCCLVYWFVKKFFGKWIARNIFAPIVNAVNSRWKLFKWYVALIKVYIPSLPLFSPSPCYLPWYTLPPPSTHGTHFNSRSYFLFLAQIISSCFSFLHSLFILRIIKNFRIAKFLTD